MEEMEHNEMNMETAVTKPQLTAMAILTIILLSIGVLIAALYGDLFMRP